MAAVLLFQGGLLGIGLLLALLPGLRPWQGAELTAAAVGLGIAGTVPLLAGVILLPAGRWEWADELTALVRRFLRLLFRGAPPGSVLLVSSLAGLGEELLFRGVIQEGLALYWHPLGALACASLLFGLAHAITPAYFVLATIMGIYLGTIHHLTGNLLIPILIHALYDWAAIHYYRRSSNCGAGMRIG